MRNVASVLLVADICGEQSWNKVCIPSLSETLVGTEEEQSITKFEQYENKV